MMSSSTEKMMKNMTKTCTGSCVLLNNMDYSSIEINVKSNKTQSHSLALSMMLIQTLRRKMQSTRCHHPITTATVLGNGHLPLTLYTQYTTMGTIEKGLRVQVEHFLSGSLWQDQGIGLQGYNSSLLQHMEAIHHSSRCIRKGTQSCTSSGRMSSCLCLQGSYPHRTMICQHRM